MAGRTQRGVTGLALLGLATGSAQVGAPAVVARLVGAEDTPTTRSVVRWAGGVRELATGLGVGAGPAPAAWLWVRVAGDVVDLALLGTVLAQRPAHRTSPRHRRIRTLAAAAAVLGVAAADVGTALRASRPARPVAD